MASTQQLAAVDLYWIPLGAGANVVRVSGKVFEGITARVHRRPPQELYHSALEVRVPDGNFVLEQAPVVDGNGERRGVVAEGPVGLRLAGRLRIFRYEVRCWRDGEIPDIGQAVNSPVRLVDDVNAARSVLEMVRSVPRLTWGRDESDAGEMWNSNSVIAWVLARSGVDLDAVKPPSGGRAPGWDAGRAIAAREG
jgi:hypothetical protein